MKSIALSLRNECSYSFEPGIKFLERRDSEKNLPAFNFGSLPYLAVCTSIVDTIKTGVCSVLLTCVNGLTVRRGNHYERTAASCKGRRRKIPGSCRQDPRL